MRQTGFNKGWKLAAGGGSLMALFSPGGAAAEEAKTITLPHDAMIHETPAADCPSGSQTGFYPGGEYTYTKTFDVPAEWEACDVMLRFGGIYQMGEIFVNDLYAASSIHGYGETLVSIGRFLRFGETNTVKVIAKNPAPNSRWYSGSGLYRGVDLLVGGPVYILPDGVRVTTRTASEEEALVDVAVRIRNISRTKKTVFATVTVAYGGETVASDKVRLSVWPGDEDAAFSAFSIPKPKLWDCDSPNLYDVTVQLCDGETVLETQTVRTGFRVVTFDGEHGLRINGKETKMRGTCIHHDNGILGAATWAAAEDKRAREMKDAGFNAIRAAHNPVSREMMDACDKYGILVMDELSDMWNEQKNLNDYAIHFDATWESEVEKMVTKDWNHPSVILYSSGNEILDLGRDNGGAVNRKICRKFKELDPTRYTTTGVNGLIAVSLRGTMQTIMGSLLAEMGIDPVAMMQQQNAPADDAAKEEGAQDGGVGAMNQVMGLMNSAAFASHPLMTEALEEAAQAADVPGFNYLTGRHVLEKELHPNKAIVATETYPADIVNLWRIVEDNPHVTGDFTWTGYDYLGEAGCGIFYYDGTVNFSSHFPDRLAYIGDINILGYRRPISYLREVVYGLRRKPYIAVGRPDHHGQKSSGTAWMYKDQIESWTWPGYEGTPVEVEIFSADPEVELLVNGVSAGRRPAGRDNGFIASFDTVYQPGELVAVGYDADGNETSRMTVETAGDAAKLVLKTERETVRANGEDIAFVTASLADAEGRPNRFAKKSVTVRVEGCGELAAFGSADPQPVESYDADTWETFEGQVMAAVRTTEEAGTIRVIFSAEGLPEAAAEIAAK